MDESSWGVPCHRCGKAELFHWCEVWAAEARAESAAAVGAACADLTSARLALAIHGRWWRVRDWRARTREITRLEERARRLIGEHKRYADSLVSD